MQDFGLNIYDCFNAGSFVGGIQSVERVKDTILRGVQIYADNSTNTTNFIALGNKTGVSSNGNSDFRSNIIINNDNNEILRNTQVQESDLDFVDENYGYVGGFKYFNDDTIGLCTN